MPNDTRHGPELGPRNSGWLHVAACLTLNPNVSGNMSADEVRGQKAATSDPRSFIHIPYSRK
eukprot:1468823-Alexandrium_andersonii.AAC.1